ncbi:hypothetical protein FE407_07430 [Leuconostoc carnosum]|uniref:hypothetical protein n=1 Tax=Leuconostoc TaxID=1243 RepID=UPI000D50A3F8|nr:MULTISPECIES: hypothetical protein [Leuconostoc]KAA8324429.1 hypothetical protein FE404_06945 [Leuconostoc carnosum]KAA8358101.1 hypothetical protein FE407_07430 [Leuconostoc carnosum]KAA8364599.1 hypothetical protein FE406_07425 [Leuconostoc carnosum]KAA8365473.1 hypothetical protein FE416_07735 [Leuconostoc carnosum]KAA8372000.1 hypothetical protein FE412_07835 [Leuconostoc carnosum]
MKTKEMIEMNNELRKNLNGENKIFYENLLLYLRIEGFARDENKIETHLLMILQDILEAQNDGIAAETYFGKNPKVIADELLAEMPRSPWEVIKTGLYVVMGYMGVSFLPALMAAGKPVDIGALGLSGLYLFSIVLILFKYIGRTIYNVNIMIQNKILKFLATFIAVSIGIAPVILIGSLVKTPVRFQLDGWSGIVVIILGLIIGAFLFIRQKDKTFSLPFVIYLCGAGVLGIMTRLPKIGHFLMDTQSGRYIVVGIIIVLLVIFWLWNILVLKKIKKLDESK